MQRMQQCEFTMSVIYFHLHKQIHTDQLTDLKRVENIVSIKLDRCLVLMGDVKIEFSSTQILKHKQKLFHYWFNTFFINEITRGNCQFFFLSLFLLVIVANEIICFFLYPSLSLFL